MRYSNRLRVAFAMAKLFCENVSPFCGCDPLLYSGGEGKTGGVPGGGKPEAFLAVPGSVRLGGPTRNASDFLNLYAYEKMRRRSK